MAVKQKDDWIAGAVHKPAELNIKPGLTIPPQMLLKAAKQPGVEGEQRARLAETFKKMQAAKNK